MILLTFFNTEAQWRILTEAHHWLQEQAPAGTLDEEAWRREETPDTQPTWDFNTAERGGVLTQCHTALLHRLKAGAKRPTNMSQTAAVIQKQEKTTDFYERLWEAFRVYTRFDLEAPENQQMANMVFVAQSYANIRWKLQKLEDFTGMNATQLLEVANKVFVNWDHEEK
jgi:hypothetical protein